MDINNLQMPDPEDLPENPNDLQMKAIIADLFKSTSDLEDVKIESYGRDETGQITGSCLVDGEEKIYTFSPVNGSYTPIFS